jgi:peptidoglycan/LPS O-acetylase OafA/YrhL
MQKIRFEVLDSFRGLSALCVVFFHMHFVQGVTELPFFRHSDHFVTLFFVLSGFVLAHGYAFKTNLNFYRFIRSRFFRLYPLHLTIFIFFFLFEVAKYLLVNYLGFNMEDAFSDSRKLIDIIPNLLLLQSWLPLFNPLSFNYPSWSISVEFYLYILLFITISLSFYKITAWLFLCTLSVFLLVNDFFILPKQALTGILGFNSGCLLYYAYHYFSKLSLKHNFILFSFLESFFVFLVVYLISYNFYEIQFFPLIVFLMVVLVFCFEGGVISVFLKQRIFLHLGKLSYSIYMVHAALLFVVEMLVNKVFHKGIFIDHKLYIDFGSQLYNDLFVLFLIIVLYFVCIFTYNKIELYWLNYAKKDHETLELKKSTSLQKSSR